MILKSIITLAAALSFSFLASAETCFGAGEVSAGMNKICYYDCLGGKASKTVSSVSLCPLSISKGESRGQSGLGSSGNNDFSGNQTCFKSGEYTSGMNKVCRYDCLGSPAETTISATQLCPLSVTR